MDILHPDSWTRPAGYSHGTAAVGEHMFVAGQVGVDHVTSVMANGFAAQSQQALQNVLDILAEGGAGPEHIVKLTWFVKSIAEYKSGGHALGDAWKATLGRNFPAITLVEVSGLIADGALVEIEAQAVV
jgi:enamine deaminase RidA (YjgF/YER057c/UK114 family)